ncbi:MAG: septum formation initiator family protein [Candidatus Omnitrophota bacterium]
MKIKLWKIVFWLIILILIFFPTYSKIQKLKSKDEVLSQKLEKLVQENEILSQEIQMLKTDPVYIEEIAREKLKVARENEIIFRVIDNDE